MDRVTTFARPDSTLNGSFRVLLPITLVIWLANLGILVTRSYAIGASTGWAAFFIRLAVSLAGAAVCLLTYKLLPRRPMTPAARFLLALGYSLPGMVVIALLHEILWLIFTDYYLQSYGIRPGDLILSECPVAAPCQRILVNAVFGFGTLIWVFVAWCAFYVSLVMAAELRERERRLNVAERTAQEAQLSALRFQLNPHFMFNTLNTLSGLIALDRKQQAEDVVLNLSSFLRFSLQSDTEQLISLDKEIEAQKMYLDIEQVRFSDRLTIEYDVDEPCQRAQVPPFLLQPLVENAIKHAVAPSDGPVTLVIGARREEDILVLEVQNSASQGLSEKRRESLGIGMKNVRKRLAALYGDRATVQAGPATDGGWANVIRLPWTERLDEDASIDRG